jgi:hypothetical protein
LDYRKRGNNRVIELYNNDFHDLHSSDVIRAKKSRRMRWAKGVARTVVQGRENDRFFLWKKRGGMEGIY